MWHSLSHCQVYFHLASSLLQSSFQHFSLTHLSLVQLSSVWFSAGSQWDLLYVQQPARVQSHLKKCQIVCVFLFYQADRPTDPQDCCPPGLPAYWAEIQYVWQVYLLPAASVRKWWLDTTAPPSGCLHSLTASWLVSSSPCICRHTTVRWPESQNITKIRLRWQILSLCELQ